MNRRREDPDMLIKRIERAKVRHEPTAALYVRLQVARHAQLRAEIRAGRRDRQRPKTKQATQKSQRRA